MVLVQIDLSDKENKIVEIYKISKDFKTKEETIKDMIMHHKDWAKAVIKNC